MEITMQNIKAIEQFRQSSREMVRELGLLADEPYYNLSLSFCHTLIELDLKGPLNQVDLIDVLRLNKSTVSRIIKKLIKFNLVTMTQAEEDQRYKLISLTKNGRKTVSEIHQSSNTQVRNAFVQLSKQEQESVIKGITLYAEALKKSHMLQQK
jgi:DNA-binding MarR family transcriptional regulator